MREHFLYEELDSFFRMGGTRKGVPASLVDNLNPDFELRPYQKQAFARFFHCLDGKFPGKERPLHLLFNMATGSGKTLIMAGLILYLYQRGYRNFLFFVNSTNIIAKTRENFLNPRSSKYLFRETIRFGDKRVTITPVDNFEGVNSDEINICFATIQQLHGDLTNIKENALTYDDFRDKKIVLLSDEAHHMNANTKAQRELELVESWENTVERLFRQNMGNLLLEFTATPDYSHPDVVNKYRNKIIYRYDLKQFRNDGYSKDIFIVQSDFEEDDRIIQAIILNQYKQEVAAKHQINLKPVILFKAQKTIAQSKENKENFHRIVSELGVTDIERIRDRSDISLLQRAFSFFDERGISDHQLVQRLRTEFDESRCISVNEENEKVKQQILLNTLEDRNNRIRAIFAVQRLNEGWDVLNLFDIVRCYETRDAKGNRPGKTTIAEAQLIGRGARYFPFATVGNPDRYTRKFDKDLTAELRILEELHYHSVNNRRYISELQSALINEGMLDEQEVEKKLRLKDSFKETAFYSAGLVYLNERIRNRYEQNRSLSDMGISSTIYSHNLATGRGATESVFGENGGGAVIPEPDSKDVKVRDIPVHIVRNALARNAFFNFRSLKTFFPHIQSMRQFIDDDAYLAGMTITFQGERHTLDSLSNEHQFYGLTGMLGEIEAGLRKGMTEYKGTENFREQSLKEIFTDKTLKLDGSSERANGDEQFVAGCNWYIFDANYGTSEEKRFVRALKGQIDRLKEQCDEIFLARNERHFKIYNFNDGQAFEPDFVLFLRNTNGRFLTYQMFIEPKGKHLEEHDRWKEQFLLEVNTRYSQEPLAFELGSRYRLIGVPFYNSENESEFMQELHAALSSAQSASRA